MLKVDLPVVCLLHLTLALMIHCSNAIDRPTPRPSSSMVLSAGSNFTIKDQRFRVDVEETMHTFVDEHAELPTIGNVSFHRPTEKPVPVPWLPPSPNVSLDAIICTACNLGEYSAHTCTEEQGKGNWGHFYSPRLHAFLWGIWSLFRLLKKSPGTIQPRRK